MVLVIGNAAVSAGTHYRRWCYYTNWSQYRSSPAKFTPENIDPFLCTQISYAFATVINGEAKNFEWNDESTPWSKGMFEKVIEIKNKNPLLQVYVAIGGWNLGSEPFTEVVATPDTRKRFITSAIQLARRNKFDGIEIDWEYPAARGSPKEDKKRLTLLLQELRMAVEIEAVTQNRARLLLAAAVSAGKSKIDAGYEVSEISKSLDMINLMAYDFHGAWDIQTGHNSPLVSRGNESGELVYWNLESASIYWLQKGAPKEKLNIGVPTYGRTFTLSNPRFTGVGAPVSGAGEAGLYTNSKGFLAYYEICHLLRNGAVEHWDDIQKVPYVVKDRLWVGYDNVRSLTEKVKWIMRMGFGGVMTWSLDLDDHAQMCGGESYPLIRSIYRTLSGDSAIVTQTTPAGLDILCSGRIDGFYPKPNDCRKFVYCKNGQDTILECTPGQAFDPVSKRCSVDMNKSCGNPSVTTVKTPRPVFIKNGGHDVTLLCINRADGTYDSPNTCDGFIICVAQKAFPLTCSAGLYFDPDRKECMYKDLVPCIGPTIAPITTTKSPANFCFRKSDGFFSDPFNCRVYHICRSGMDFPQQCGPHQMFKDGSCVISDDNCVRSK